MSAKRIRIFFICLAALLLAGVAVYAASGYGSQEDPLVTKSYLDSVFRPEVEEAMTAEAQRALGTVQRSGDFTLVTLRRGQRVTGAVGTELLLRFGAAGAYAYDSADTALVDTTSAEAVSAGTSLVANHLYMITIEGNGFTAAADNTKALISGTYQIG